MKKITFYIFTIIFIKSFVIAGSGVSPAVEPVIDLPEVSLKDSHRGVYIGLGISAVSTRKSSHSFWDDYIIEGEDALDRTGQTSFLVGYDFNKYFALESRYMVSHDHEDKLEQSSWGIYAKPQYLISKKINLYALIGYGGIDVKSIDERYQIDVDEKGFQWGMGLSYAITEKISVYADYLNIIDDKKATAFFKIPENVTSDAFTVGVMYKF